MKKIFLLFLILGLAISNSSFGQETINASIMYDGLQRDYIVYLPASYSSGTDSPLLFHFHGFDGTAAFEVSARSFNSVADTANFIVVYPQGTVYENATHWNVGGFIIGSTVDDVGFIDALLDELIGNYSIDTDRIYSSGMSNGGFMTFLLGCQLSERIAAIASVAGSMTPEVYNACNPQRPMPVFQMHGTLDNTVSYSGESWTRSIEDVLEYWVNFNATEDPPSTINIPDINPNDGRTTEQIIYANGDNCSSVEHFRVTGGDHDWPGEFGNQEIIATVEVWKFLSRYDINGLIECTVTGTNVGSENQQEISVFPNPTNALIRVRNISTPMKFEILNLLGESTKVGTLQFNDESIDLSDLTSNIYFFRIGNQMIKIIKL